MSSLKFPLHIIPVATGTASTPTYPQTNGLDMRQLVQVAQDVHGVPYTIETQPYYRQEYNPLIDQITTTKNEYPTLLPCDQMDADAPRWILEHTIFGYFVLSPFTLSFSPLGHQGFVSKAAKNERKFDSNGRPPLRRNKDGWQVKSKSDPNITHYISFTVSSFGITYYCTCKGSKYRRNCWHVKEARKLGKKDKRVQQALKDAQEVDDFNWLDDSNWG